MNAVVRLLLFHPSLKNPLGLGHRLEIIDQPPIGLDRGSHRRRRTSVVGAVFAPRRSLSVDQWSVMGSDVPSLAGQPTVDLRLWAAAFNDGQTWVQTASESLVAERLGAQPVRLQ